ncbi:MAG: peptidoglycan DD-metalloendopeptidase family protein [Steroidobacteraceae bacterium]
MNRRAQWHRWWVGIRAFMFSVALACGVFACASTPERPAAYTVRSGDTLYSIATRYDLDFRVLARWNDIGPDYRIYPGQKLRLSPRGGHATATAKTPTKSSPAPQTPTGPPVQWQWPAKGTAFARTQRPNGGQGLTIQGELNQSIRAAGPGRVVYTGSGLLGYGQLLIIKHNDAYLSAYAHTSSMLVKEGDIVTGGQPVATMGAGAQGQPMLYFEIRVNGKPVDPLLFLPQQ